MRSYKPINMKLPAKYIGHLDHRITVLLSFTLRRDLGFFGPDHGEAKGLGDLYRASLEGSGIMLRALLELLGAKCDYRKNPVGLKAKSGSDARLGSGELSKIPPLDISRLAADVELRLAKLHDGISKRTGHPAFNKLSVGLDPAELSWGTEWILKEIWERCYAPKPIIIHRDIVRLLKGSEWKGIPFCPSS
jgi:hypothetical protein